MKTHLTFTLLLTLTLSPFAFAKSDANPIENFEQVAPGVYRGASPGPKGVAYLKKMGFKTILNLEARKSVIKKEKAAAEKYGIRWESYPITLFTLPKDDTLDWMLDLMADTQNHPIFVHCRAGRDRTGMMIGLYRAEVQKWDPAHAWQEMLDKGFRRFYFPLTRIFERRTGINVRKQWVAQER